MKMQAEKFLRNEFLTMSVLGALGRSKTYSESVSPEDKNRFRIALREKLDKISRMYESVVTEEEHLQNIRTFADDLTSRFSHCLRHARFRIGIAQKALNLYLKYLWCADLVGPPPHCPFDSIVIGHLPDCGDLNWTSIDAIEEYTRLVEAARKAANGRPLTEWELEIWQEDVESERMPKQIAKSGTDDVRETLVLGSPLSSVDEGSDILIVGTVTSQGRYRPDNKDICELYISKESSGALPHGRGQEHPISLTIGGITYEACVHETQVGIVWISSVLHATGLGKEKTRLVDALAGIRLKRGDKITIKSNTGGPFVLQKYGPA